MPTIEELQKEIEKIKKDNLRKEQKLRNIKEGKREMKELGKMKKKLQSELKGLKNPKTTALKKSIKPGIKKGARLTGAGIKTAFKAAERFVEGFEDFEEAQTTRRKPTKRKTTKRKAKARIPKRAVRKTTKRKTTRRKPTKRKTTRRNNNNDYSWF